MSSDDAHDSLMAIARVVKGVEVKGLPIQDALPAIKIAVEREIEMIEDDWIDEGCIDTHSRFDWEKL